MVMIDSPRYWGHFLRAIGCVELDDDARFAGPVAGSQDQQCAGGVTRVDSDLDLPFEDQEERPPWAAGREQNRARPAPALPGYWGDQGQNRVFEARKNFACSQLVDDAVHRGRLAWQFVGRIA